MKRSFIAIRILILVCATLSACKAGDKSDPTASSVPTVETSIATPASEDSPESSVVVTGPKLPTETFPEKPAQDYTLPPGEKPTVPPVDR
jgi:hypothetical protein